MLRYGYLGDFIIELRSNGRYAFSLAEVRSRYNQSAEAIKKALQRLRSKQEIVLIRNEFYAILPPEFRRKGMLPPSLFVADLMKFLGRDYYVGLLTAAACYGAAYEEPPGFSVVTRKPSLRDIDTRTLTIDFNIKKQWSAEDTIQKKVGTGFMNVSSPELTALDLVFFFDKIGGFHHISKVLERMTASMDAQKLVSAAQRFYQVTTIQRLGFLLSEVLNKKELSAPLAGYMKTLNYFPVLLQPEKRKPKSMIAKNDWKVVKNVDIGTKI